MKNLQPSRQNSTDWPGRLVNRLAGKHLSIGRLAAHESELDKLHSQLESIIANDFFEANGRTSALTAYERCQKAIRAAHGPVSKATRSTIKSGTLDPTKYQGRRWMTRRNLHIDRLASAWLIRTVHRQTPALLLCR